MVFTDSNPPIIVNQLEHMMDNEMETGIIEWSIGCRAM